MMFFKNWTKKGSPSKKNPNTNISKDSSSLSKEIDKVNIKQEQNDFRPPSLLGKEIKINGKITSTGELQVDGVVEGEIQAIKLVIEQSAKIVGSVSSDDLVIKGRIIGPVYGKKVRFGSTARVEGDTFHETIAIEDGAYYEGSIKRHASLVPVANIKKSEAT